jgi:hypothetical protein
LNSDDETKSYKEDTKYLGVVQEELAESACREYGACFGVSDGHNGGAYIVGVCEPILIPRGCAVLIRVALNI